MLAVRRKRLRDARTQSSAKQEANVSPQEKKREKPKSYSGLLLTAAVSPAVKMAVLGPLGPQNVKQTKFYHINGVVLYIKSGLIFSICPQGAEFIL